MPVQFKCTQCKKTLKITRRKIGVEVSCPLCGAKLIVPAADEAGTAGDEVHTLADDGGKAETAPVVKPASAAAGTTSKAAVAAGAAAAAAAAAVASSKPPTSAQPEEDEYEDDDGLIDEFIVYDGPPAEEAKGDPPPVTPAAATPPTTPAVAGSSSNVAVPLRVGSVHVPPGTVLIPRWSLFVMTFLLFAATGGAYWTGYTIGLAEGPLANAENAGTPSELLVEGRLIYQPRPGETMGDVGAVVIVLPQDADPSPKLDYGGLRPDEVAMRGFNEASVAAVRAIGGNVIDTDREGTYLTTLKKKGKYFLLGISRYTERKPGVDIDPEHAAILDRYFTDGRLLIGAKKYTFRLQAPDAPRQPVVSFGTSRE